MSIKFDKRNYRKHNDKNKDLIKKSLSECGAGRSIVIDNENEIIAGNGIYEQAQKLGLKTKIIETDGSELVVVKRTDLATDDDKRKQLAVMDNSSSDTSEFDLELLEQDFEIDTLNDWGIDIEIEEPESEVVEETEDFEENHLLQYSCLFNTDLMNIENVDFPVIHKEDELNITNLLPFERTKSNDGVAHFFMNDYMFESLWNNPIKNLDKLLKYEAVCTPDFSLYLDFPIPIQIYQVFRNRWLGVFWQQLGIKVIPTISWSNAKSFDFCFKGVEKGCTVAISTVRINKNKEIFVNGFKKMIEVIEPEMIIVNGSELQELECYNNIKYFKPFYNEIRKRGK